MAAPVSDESPVAHRVYVPHSWWIESTMVLYLRIPIAVGKWFGNEKTRRRDKLCFLAIQGTLPTVSPFDSTI